MKHPLACLTLALFASAVPALAEEAANPFVKKPAAHQPLPPPGASFASLVENFLVPPDLLDDWLRDNPLKDDATALRNAVQAWVVAGKAQSDHSTLTLGTAGRESACDSIIEKIYPTEFYPGGVGAWPWPTAFDTRNLGHTLSSGVTKVDETESTWAKLELVEMLSSDSSQPLIEQTRQPSDTFLPRVRAMDIKQHDADAPADSNDPFASPSAPSTPVDFTLPHGVVFSPGVYHLAGRFDPIPDDTSGNKLTRLVFYRSEIAAPPEKSANPAPAPKRASFRVLRVSLPAFSAWIIAHSPLSAKTDAWAAAENWRTEGQTENIGELSSTVRESATNTMSNVIEHIYPTEVEPGTDTTLVEKWEEGKKKDGKDGVATMSRYKVTARPGLEGAGLATAFDTRNLGTTVESLITREGSGFLVRCSYDRVRLLGESISHRIKVGDEWIPDYKMPIFTATRLASTIRVAPSQWTLLGETSEFLKSEMVDRDHCLLVFVKVD
ncbi:MAG: hypothetical protein V4640_16625 [Verrucomicrobiota bacterium]